MTQRTGISSLRPLRVLSFDLCTPTSVFEWRPVHATWELTDWSRFFIAISPVLNRFSITQKGMSDILEDLAIHFIRYSGPSTCVCAILTVSLYVNDILFKILLKNGSIVSNSTLQLFTRIVIVPFEQCSGQRKIFLHWSTFRIWWAGILEVPVSRQSN